jgi:hypothetical protein
MIRRWLLEYLDQVHADVAMDIILVVVVVGSDVALVRRELVGDHGRRGL